MKGKSNRLLGPVPWRLHHSSRAFGTHWEHWSSYQQHQVQVQQRLLWELELLYKRWISPSQ
jgi:hypothetical protein